MGRKAMETIGKLKARPLNLSNNFFLSTLFLDFFLHSQPINYYRVQVVGGTVSYAARESVHGKKFCFHRDNLISSFLLSVGAPDEDNTVAGRVGA